MGELAWLVQDGELPAKGLFSHDLHHHRWGVSFH